MTPPKPRRARVTSAYAAELREEIAELEGRLGARLDALEQRRDAGEVLAEELGQAALRTLRRPIRPKGPL